MSQRSICLSLSGIVILLLFFWYAPDFLTYSDLLRKSDAVVVFVGPDNESRLDEAKQLVREGYARYLLIPSLGKVYSVDSAGKLVGLVGKQPRMDLSLRISMATPYKKYYEKTHIEALQAKRMLDILDLKSATLVSSAYHMRRIGLIAARVFDARKYSITCIAARNPAPFSVADWLNKERLQIIISEYVKMGWFLIYGTVGS